MRHFGIIGYPLLHSFSAKYFNEKFATEKIDAEFSLYPLLAEQIPSQIEGLFERLDGFNVTLPYKQAIIPYLDRLDETAQVIGAVNVVHQRVGYNTDCIGFMESIQPLLREYDTKALVLGTGGASKAVCYGLRKLGITPTLVSRSPKEGMLGYEELKKDIMAAHTVIVNCTPLGMLPDVDSCPAIPYELITPQHLLFDCVYNPEETLFLRKGKAQGATIQNGIGMLLGQARAAWQIWNSVQQNACINKHNKIKHMMKKLFFVLVGMMMIGAMQATIIEENEPALIYYTPKTVLALDFTYTVEKEEVGPYAQFAADMLGATDFVKENKTVYTLQNVMIGTKTEADPTRPHKVVPEKGLDMQLLRLNEKNILVGYNIPVETEKAAHPKHHTSTTEGVKSRINSIHVAPYPEEVLKAGTPQAQAYEIAKQIFHIRETRMYLLSGEVEHAPADGKAMELVLAELDKQERELTELFVGKRSVTTEHKRILWDHITRDNYMVRASQKDFLYFSEENGFTDKDNVDADSITIFIGHRAQEYTLPRADKNSKKGEALSQISYNLPGSAIVRIIYQGRLLGERTIPVAQLGVDVPLPQSLFTGKQLPKIQFNEKTGNIISISK